MFCAPAFSGARRDRGSRACPFDTIVGLVRQRLAQVILITSTLIASWLAMMCIHEFGHVLHAWLTSGHVQRVVLHPLRFSRTDVSPNPCPLLVAIGGCLWGSLVPLLLWLTLRRIARVRGVAFLLRFFAGFCLLANGAYLASVLLTPVGDAGDLVQLGTPRWVLGVSGLAMSAIGLAMGNGLGPDFGLAGAGDRKKISTTSVTIAVTCAFVLLMATSIWSAFAAP